MIVALYCIVCMIDHLGGLAIFVNYVQAVPDPQPLLLKIMPENDQLLKHLIIGIFL